MASPHPPAPLWLVVPMAAATLAVAGLFGWLLHQRLDLLLHAPRWPGTIVALESSQSVSTNSSNRRASTRLEVVTEVEAPRGPSRFTTLAPLLYPMASEGDRVTVFEANGRFVLGHPASLGLHPLLALLPLGFLFAIVDKVMMPARHRRVWHALVVVALLAPLVVGPLRAN